MEEHLLSINVFNKPDIKVGSKADAQLIFNLFTAKNSISPVSQNLGFDIDKYRFKDMESNLKTIETQFRLHCSKYLPHIYINEMRLKPINKKVLAIGISIFNTNNSTQSDIIFKVKEQNSKLLVELLEK